MFNFFERKPVVSVETLKYLMNNEKDVEEDATTSFLVLNILDREPLHFLHFWNLSGLHYISYFLNFSFSLFFFNFIFFRKSLKSPYHSSISFRGHCVMQGKEEKYQKRFFIVLFTSLLICFWIFYIAVFKDKWTRIRSDFQSNRLKHTIQFSLH